MLKKLTTRSFKHWTPRYIFNRIRLLAQERRHPEHPWFTGTAITIIESLLRKTDFGLEFGAGRSTPWFAGRVGQLVSIEHNRLYHEKVINDLKDRNISNVDLRLIEQDKPEEVGKESRYVRVIQEFSENSLDFVLVDGVYRAHCALGVLDRVKPGGILILDNSNWFVPSDSRAPNSQREPASEEWAEFLDLVSDWRSIWTSNGVWDTTLYFKSCRMHRK